MNELLELTIDTHVFSILGTMILVMVNIIVVNSTNDFDVIAKRVRFFLPMYYTCLSIVLFTGLIIMGVQHFAFSLSITSMIIVWLVNFVLTIKAYKVLKRARKHQDTMYKNQFIWFVRRKWVTDLVLMVFVTLFAWQIGI